MRLPINANHLRRSILAVVDVLTARITRANRASRARAARTELDEYGELHESTEVYGPSNGEGAPKVQ